MIEEIITVTISLFLNYILIKNLDEKKFNLKKDELSTFEYFFIIYNMIIILVPLVNVLMSIFNLMLFTKENTFDKKYKNIFKRFFEKE